MRTGPPRRSSRGAPAAAAMRPTRSATIRRAKTAVPDWPDGNLPAAYLYKDGSMRKQLVGSREIATGPPPFTALSVERKLVELGVLKVEDVEEEASDEEREASESFLATPNSARSSAAGETGTAPPPTALPRLLNVAATATCSGPYSRSSIDSARSSSSFCFG